MTATQFIINELQKAAIPKSAEHLNRFGIFGANAIGTRLPDIRAIAKSVGTNHSLALALWRTNIHEAKILASMLADANLFKEKDFDTWVNDFDSWDVCDQCCGNLFKNLPYIESKILAYANHTNEYQKRFSYAMIAVIAVHWKKSEDAVFEKYFPILINASNDDRNFVKKAVNWAIRQIGKRNLILNDKAIALCETLLATNIKSAHWIAKDAIKELTSPAIQNRLFKK